MCVWGGEITFSCLLKYLREAIIDYSSVYLLFI